MQRALFVYLPEDAWRARVVASKWVGAERIVVAVDDFGWNEVPLVRTIGARDIWARPPSLVVVVVTGGTGTDRYVRECVDEAVRRGVPVVGIDASRIRDEFGGTAQPGSSWPEFRRYYKWWLDNGELEIGEWVDYEIAAAAGQRP